MHGSWHVVVLFHLSTIDVVPGKDTATINRIYAAFTHHCRDCNGGGGWVGSPWHQRRCDGTAEERPEQEATTGYIYFNMVATKHAAITTVVGIC